MKVAAVILAAGFSRRLGRPKQTVEIGGETLVARTVRVAHKAGLSPVFVVVQPGADFVRELLALPCTPVWNNEAEEGLAASVRAGVQAAQATAALAGVVLMTCDQVGTEPWHLQALCTELHRITGSAYAGRVAVPAYFPQSAYGELLALIGDAGARTLLQGAHSVPSEALALDIDTEADVARARSLLE